MRERRPITWTLELSEVKNTLSRLVDKGFRKETRVLVEQSGQPVAALVSADDLRRLDQLDREWNDRTAVIVRFSRAFADAPADEAVAEVARIIAERRQRRHVESVNRPA